jgi:hypothetical protein
MRAALLSALFCLALPAAGLAQQATAEDLPAKPKRVTGAELQREITGNTVGGRHATGMPFSEFHAPDGRIYGHNNHEPVRDGCWVIRGDDVCYTYEKGTAPGIFCWEFYRATNGYTILLPRTGTVGTAKIEEGNPHNWGHGGDPWSCDALLSWRGPGPDSMVAKAIALARGERFIRLPAANLIDR